jgi:hypothetical protein
LNGLGWRNCLDGLFLLLFLRRDIRGFLALIAGLIIVIVRVVVGERPPVFVIVFFVVIAVRIEITGRRLIEVITGIQEPPAGTRFG